MKELDWENYIVQNPDYIEPGLKLLYRQHKVDGGIIDLVFIDSKNKYLILELQIGKLDPSHFSRSLYYRALFCEKHKVDISQVRVAVVSHSINNCIAKLCQSYAIEMFFLQETDAIIEEAVLIREQSKDSKKVHNYGVLDFYGQTAMKLEDIVDKKHHQLFVQFYKYLAVHQKVEPKTEAEILSMDHFYPNCWLMISDNIYDQNSFKLKADDYQYVCEQRKSYYHSGVYKDLSPAIMFNYLKDLKIHVDGEMKIDRYSLTLQRLFRNKYLPERFIICYLKINERYYKPLQFESALEKNVISGLCSGMFKHLPYKRLSDIFHAGLYNLKPSTRELFNHLPQTYTDLSCYHEY